MAINRDQILKACSGAVFLWAFRRKADSPAMFIHLCFRREMWRESSLAERIRLLLTFLLWPFLVLTASGFLTWRNGRVVKRLAGKGVAKQFLEQIKLASTQAILPPWYYIFGLYDDARRSRAWHYLNRFETKRGVYDFLRKYYRAAPAPAAHDSMEVLSNKALFTARCQECGVAVVDVLMRLEDGKIIGATPDQPKLPPMDLFIKRLRGAGGKGAMRWEYLGDGRYRNHRGRMMGAGELLNDLKRLSLERGYLVEPRLINHPEIADLSNGALTTVRIMTCRNERGDFEPIHAVFRMAQGVNTIVDNAHAGGIVATVEMTTGILGRGIDGALGLGGAGWRERHPDTGARFAGRRLPDWERALALVKQAHTLAFADMVVLGWDVGLLESGPRLIEGNKRPDVDLMQMALGPLGNARLGELLAYNLKRALEIKYK
jgi:hypothetical protein